MPATWARKGWATTAHIVVNGDTLALCGRSADGLCAVEAAVWRCPDCVAAAREVGELAEAGSPSEMCRCGHQIESHCMESERGSCITGGGCHALCDCPLSFEQIGGVS